MGCRMTPMRAAKAVAAAALVVPTACSGPDKCALQPVVVLTDANTGHAICDATVVAVTHGDAADDGGPTGAFVVVAGGPKGCEYRAQFSELEPYSIDVSAPGYAPYSFAGAQPIALPCDQVASPGTIAIALRSN